jgi:hypothetical protein
MRERNSASGLIFSMAGIELARVSMQAVPFQWAPGILSEDVA